MIRKIDWTPSPNYDERPKGSGPSLVILHGTAGGFPHDYGWLRDPKSGVSAHYYVRRDGKLYQLVQESQRAWHAGKSIYQGKTGVNAFSIGIELENNGKEPFSNEQYDALGWLCADIAKRRGFDLRHFLGHADVAGKHLNIRPDPKTDPWGAFSWPTFQRLFILHRHDEPALPAARHHVKLAA